MFLFCKIAFNICKINGGVPSYFSCHRATNDRVRFTLFGKRNCQCPVATIGIFPLLESLEGLLSRPVPLPLSAKCVQLVETTT